MTRRRPGLSTRIAEFFAANPNEWLSREDMVVKFSCSPSSLENALRDINAYGRKIEAVSVWRVVKGAKL